MDLCSYNACVCVRVGNFLSPSAPAVRYTARRFLGKYNMKLVIIPTHPFCFPAIRNEAQVKYLLSSWTSRSRFENKSYVLLIGYKYLATDTVLKLHLLLKAMAILLKIISTGEGMCEIFLWCFQFLWSFLSCKWISTPGVYLTLLNFTFYRPPPASSETDLTLSLCFWSLSFGWPALTFPVHL